jgi:FtsP/CotA-like multicopper oxidase with cupredoxin domain
LTFNDQIPGPTIEANWGDTIRVHVTNELQDNGTSVHWHGFRQLNSNDQDGVNGITECPTAPGDSKTYEFQATNYGTSWYHSHFSTQYGDGVVGPIVIHGPASADYDIDLGPIGVQDWFHTTSFQKMEGALHVGPPKAENYLWNGVNAPAGNETVTGPVQRFGLSFKKGKKHLLRFVNMSTDNFFKIILDNHKFTVISNDFVPVTPFETDIIPLGVGQRYDVIVEAKEDVSNYWLRAVAASVCSENTNDGLGSANGIVSYEGATADVLPTTVVTAPSNDCEDIPASSLVPVVSKSVPETSFAAEASILPVSGPTITNQSYGENIFTWSLNGEAIDIDWKEPSLKKLQDGTAFTPSNNVIELDQANVWTYWIIQNTFPVPHP